MSKTQKVLFQRYYNSQKYLDSQKVSKPAGDQERPSFARSMQTTIVGVELEEIALEEKLEKDLSSEAKEKQQNDLPPTYDPHNLVMVQVAGENPQPDQRPEDLRSRDLPLAEEQADEQAERQSAAAGSLA